MKYINHKFIGKPVLLTNLYIADDVIYQLAAGVFTKFLIEGSESYGTIPCAQSWDYNLAKGPSEIDGVPEYV